MSLRAIGRALGVSERTLYRDLAKVPDVTDVTPSTSAEPEPDPEPVPTLPTRALGISPETVKRHLASIYSKLAIPGRVALATHVVTSRAA